MQIKSTRCPDWSVWWYSKVRLLIAMRNYTFWNKVPEQVCQRQQYHWSHFLLTSKIMLKWSFPFKTTLRWKSLRQICWNPPLARSFPRWVLYQKLNIPILKSNRIETFHTHLTIFRIRLVARWVSGWVLEYCKWSNWQLPVHHQSSQDARRVRTKQTNLFWIFSKCIICIRFKALHVWITFILCVDTIM